MSKIILFAALWGSFWDTIFFDGKGFYLAPLLLMAVFIYYSPFVLKFLNIALAGFLAFTAMFLRSAFSTVNGFIGPSYDFIFHMAVYLILSIFLISLIYAMDEKKTA